MPAHTVPTSEERLLTATRLLSVLEQLFNQAALDPNRSPFSGPHVPDFCLGVVEIIRTIQDSLSEIKPRIE